MQRQLSALRLILGLLCLGACALADQNVQAQQPAASTTSAMTEMAAAKANAALIKSAYDAFSRGDIQGAMAAFAEGIFWHVPGRGPLSRDYRGHAEVLGFFGHFMDLSGGTFRLQVDDVLAKGDRVVVFCTESAQRGGRSWSAPQVHVWTVKDGKATVFWEYEGDQQGDDEFWSSPG
jgi:ketosteroid isomerase-like protein